MNDSICVFNRDTVTFDGVSESDAKEIKNASHRITVDYGKPKTAYQTARHLCRVVKILSAPKYSNIFNNVTFLAH